jgi:hypothetical protein
MANYMEEVAKMLGVELGKRFKIVDVGSNKPISEFNYYFTDKDIEIDAEGRACSGEYLLTHLIYGDFIIKRKPWKPEDGDSFFFVIETGDVYDSVFSSEFGSDHLNYYKLGNCYRTKEQAEANRDKWVTFYASDEVLEV